MLNEPTVPPVIRRTFDRTLATFLRPDDPRPPDNQRAIRPAQQVFSLGLEPLSENQSIPDNAKPASWRFLIAAGSGKGLYATVTRHDHEPAEFIGLSRGVQAAVAVQADQDVRKLPAAQAASYNLCVLAIPGLLTEAFWLKWVAPDGTESDPSKDLIVPFVTAQKELMPMHPYKMSSSGKSLFLWQKRSWRHSNDCSKWMIAESRNIRPPRKTNEPKGRRWKSLPDPRAEAYEETAPLTRGSLLLRVISSSEVKPATH